MTTLIEKGRTTLQKIRSFFVKLLVAVVILVVLGAAFFTFTNMSEGTRSGSVIKFSHKGYVFKTWEGELVQRNFSTQADTWHFSVNDDEIAREINEAVNKGEKVALHYRQKYFKLFWQGDTEYFIHKIDRVQDDEQPNLPPRQH